MVQINDDIFIGMLWDRVENNPFGNPYDDEFWNDCFDFLSTNGWLEVEYNDPKYIIDNIIVNGEIVHKDDVEGNYDLKGKSVEEWVSDNGYSYCGDYIVINWGL